MTNPINCSNHSIPAYSGVTINISNPTLNAAPLNQYCQECNQGNYPCQPNFAVNGQYLPENNGMTNPLAQTQPPVPQQVTPQTMPVNSVYPQNIQDKPAEQELKQDEKNNIQQAYPPQYYLNNYNYVQNGEKGNNQAPALRPQANTAQIPPSNKPAYDSTAQEEDMSSSQGIIDALDSKVQEQKDLEKSGKQSRVVALTNEYIMSLENYLNNPNTEIRLMASKEILTRLDEDKNRYDDAALNALLNKMLQDPEKLIRIAALSAFSSQLASGNDYTVKLLTDIQNNPNSDKEDVVQAADCLLKMSSSTEVKYIPQHNNLPQQEITQVEQQ